MKRNKFLSLAMALVFTTTQAFAASIGDDNVDLGKTTSTGDKSITFKGPTSSKKLKGSQAGALGYNGNSLSIGDGLNTANKTFTFDKGGSSPFFQYNFSTGAIDTGNLSILNHTGNNLYIGDGTNTNKVLKFNKGASSPEIRFNSATGKLQFTNDTVAYKDIGSGSGGGGGTNLLQDVNPDFESGSPPQNWTASGGTFTANSSTPLFGLQSGNWDASALNQTLTSALVTIQRGFIGKRCTADIEYRWPSGVSGDLSFQVVNQATSILASVNLDPTTGSNTQKALLAFDCPTTATDQLAARLIANVANPAAIDIDDAFVGVNKSTNRNTQTQLVVSAKYSSVAGCDPAVNNTSFALPAAIAACPAITVISSTIPVTTVDSDQLDLVLPNIPVGRYLLRVTGTHQGSAANQWVGYRVGDGTNWGPPVGRRGSTTIDASTFTATYEFDQTISGAKTFRIQAAADSGTAYVRNSPTNGINAETHFELVRYPSVAADSLNVETTGWLIDANLGGASVTMSGIQASYTEQTNANLDLVINSAKGSASAEVPCSGTNPSTGLTCAAGNESVGIVFTPPYAGLFEVCGSYWFSITNGHAVAQQWVETPNNAQTILQEGGDRPGASFSIAAGNVEHMVRLCGTFNFTSVTKKTLRVMYESPDAATHILALGRDASLGQRDMHITVRPLTQSMPMPVFTELQNKVSTPGYGNDTKFCSFYVSNGIGVSTPCSSAGCTTQKIKGGCANIGSVSRSSAGRYTYTFPGGYWNAPTEVSCSLALSSGGSGRLWPYLGDDFNASSRSFNFDNSGATGQDASFEVFCHGR